MASRKNRYVTFRRISFYILLLTPTFCTPLACKLVIPHGFVMSNDVYRRFHKHSSSVLHDLKISETPSNAFLVPPGIVQHNLLWSFKVLRFCIYAICKLPIVPAGICQRDPLPTLFTNSVNITTVKLYDGRISVWIKHRSWYFRWSQLHIHFAKRSPKSIMNTCTCVWNITAIKKREKHKCAISWCFRRTKCYSTMISVPLTSKIKVRSGSIEMGSSQLLYLFSFVLN